MAMDLKLTSTSSLMQLDGTLILWGKGKEEGKEGEGKGRENCASHWPKQVRWLTSIQVHGGSITNSLRYSAIPSLSTAHKIKMFHFVCWKAAIQSLQAASIALVSGLYSFFSSFFWKYVPLFSISFCFVLILELELRSYTLNHSTSPPFFVRGFSSRVS
jgi:hypothetical protein